MEVVHGACAGLDVHQKTVVACARVIVGDKVVQEVKTFETMTRELLALCDWLSERGVTHVAMESTGVYYFRSICANASGNFCRNLRTSLWLFSPQSARNPVA